MTDGAALSTTGTQPRPHRLQDQTPLQVRQWRDLARLFTTTSCQLDKALHEQHGIGMSEFEILDRLAEADDCAARMQELADEVHLSQSALSRAVDRLEREGLVARASCSTDRRGVFVNITEDGRARWRDACPTQRAVLATTLSSETGAQTEPAATAATA
ncbi:MarR family winged helix-turn-helix transcriptional regulator [Hamadaea tsunoensis]|uniref:MarR family winged helix-turn-helix transcriptional regulator n=1 Tax=Hamadaea tsunoensis TaxID=53368 RepID=UPI0004293E4E|nr:MarR family transcriptional regulator [Hamadaea tsunoensis]